MYERDSIELFDASTGQYVSAKIVALSREDASVRIDAVWWSGLGIGKRLRRKQEDHHWRWAKIISERRNDPNYRAVAIDVGDERLCGAMSYRLDGKSWFEKSCNAVEIDRLATDPANRANLVESARFRGVGVALIRFAIRESIKFGLDGRIILWSLPNPHTRTFYENRGFRMFEKQANGMIGYELRSDDARRLLSEE